MPEQQFRKDKPWTDGLRAYLEPCSNLAGSYSSCETDAINDCVLSLARWLLQEFLCRNLPKQHLCVLSDLIALNDANIVYSKVLCIDASQEVQEGIMDGSAAFERCFIDNKIPISC
jgi:hypothetical protein